MITVDSFENAILLVRIFVDEGYHSSVIINDDDSYTVEFWCDEDDDLLNNEEDEEDLEDGINLAFLVADLLDALDNKKCDKK